MTSHQLEQLLRVEWNDEGRTGAESVVACFSVLLIHSPEATTCLELVLKVKGVCLLPCTVSVMCQELQWRLARLPATWRDGMTCLFYDALAVIWNCRTDFGCASQISQDIRIKRPEFSYCLDGLKILWLFLCQLCLFSNSVFPFAYWDLLTQFVAAPYIQWMDYEKKVVFSQGLRATTRHNMCFLPAHLAALLPE